ncbi:hypothetical protein F383_35284 [Gossypium arboreum]|uniref:Uncharacterized protein n=1 Tax=Gossypium arboreum TaxID=29729 RepID=A0A0B0N8R4_GOSAR|nr:hypothetical protein F383_35284 [Gossypium arboreum]
MVIPMKQINP